MRKFIKSRSSKEPPWSFEKKLNLGSFNSEADALSIKLIAASYLRQKGMNCVLKSK
jgi:hypothetical protein